MSSSSSDMRLARVVRLQCAVRSWMARRQRRLRAEHRRLQEQVEQEGERHAYHDLLVRVAIDLLQRLGRGATARWSLAGWRASSAYNGRRPFTLRLIGVSNWVVHVPRRRTIALQCDLDDESGATKSNGVVAVREGWVQAGSRGQPPRLRGGGGRHLRVVKELRAGESTSMALTLRSASPGSSPFDIDWRATSQAGTADVVKQKRSDAPSSAVVVTREVDIAALFASTHRDLWRLSLPELDALYNGARAAQSRTQAEDERRRLRAMGLTPATTAKTKARLPAATSFDRSAVKDQSVNNSYSAMPLAAPSRLPAITAAAHFNRSVFIVEAERRNEVELAEESARASLLFAIARRRATARHPHRR